MRLCNIVKIILNKKTCSDWKILMMPFCLLIGLPFTFIIWHVGLIWVGSCWADFVHIGLLSHWIKNKKHFSFYVVLIKKFYSRTVLYFWLTLYYEWYLIFGCNVVFVTYIKVHDILIYTSLNIYIVVSMSDYWSWGRGFDPRHFHKF